MEKKKLEKKVNAGRWGRFRKKYFLREEKKNNSGKGYETFITILKKNCRYYR